MALDKLVDSAKLDAALAYEANKIRAKTGGSSNVAFDLANGKGFGDAIEAITEIPAHLGHMSLTPATDLRSVQIPIGDAKVVLIASDYPWTTPTKITVVGGAIYFTSSGSPYSAGSRIIAYTTAPSVSGYASTSGGGQSWSVADGVATIANTSGWVFAAGVTYDFFWY